MRTMMALALVVILTTALPIQRLPIGKRATVTWYVVYDPGDGNTLPMKGGMVFWRDWLKSDGAWRTERLDANGYYSAELVIGKITPWGVAAPDFRDDVCWCSMPDTPDGDASGGVFEPLTGPIRIELKYYGDCGVP